MTWFANSTHCNRYQLIPFSVAFRKVIPNKDRGKKERTIFNLIKLHAWPGFLFFSFWYGL